MKQQVIWLLKICISAGILAYLSYAAWQDKSFEALVHEPKHWGLFGLAVGAALAAMLLTHARWFLLVRALGLPFALKDAVRLGFIGHLFTFFTLGIVGGDLLKAIFICREQPRRKTQAVASVVIDRIIGLYALFVMASAAFYLSDLSGEKVVRVCQATVSLTVVGTCGLALLLVPGFTELALWKPLLAVPKVGGLVQRMLSAVRMYRERPFVLFVSFLMSLVVHAFSTLSVYLVARGLPGASLTLAAHFVIVPISLVANALPLPGGLGGLEAALNFLYLAVAEGGAAGARGFVIALAYRLITVLFALVGAYYYIAGRGQVEALLHEADTLPAAPSPNASGGRMQPGENPSGGAPRPIGE